MAAINDIEVLLMTIIVAVLLDSPAWTPSFPATASWISQPLMKYIKWNNEIIRNRSNSNVM